MGSTTVTRHGQITISKDIREQLGIVEGTKLIVNTMGDTIFLKKIDETTWDNIESFLPENFEEIMKEYRKASYPRY